MPAPLLLPMSVLALASALGVLSSTIVLPSFPDMARGLPAPLGQIQLTLTVFLAVFAAGMPVAGPLSDRFGRRRVLLAGLWMFAIGGAIGALAQDIATLLASRGLQAAGACAGATVARAAVRDLFDRTRAAKVLAVMSIVSATMPVVAPVFGGALHEAFGWRANFLVPALGAAALIALAWRGLPETVGGAPAPQGLWRASASAHRLLLGSRRFLGYGCALAGGLGGYYAFATGAPAILIEALGVPVAAFGFYSGLPSVGFIVGSFVSNRLAARAGIDRLIAIGTALTLAAGLAMAGLGLAFAPTPLLFVGPMILFGFGNGLVTANAYAGCVSLFPGIAGAASGLSGFLHTVGGMAGTVAVTLLPHQSGVTVGLVIAGCGLCGTAGFRLFGRAARGGG